MPTRRKVAPGSYLLCSVLLFSGWITSCTPTLVNPIEPNSALVMGRVVINNKYSGPGLLLPLGTIEDRIEVEVESTDGNQLFKAKTEEQGYFFIPNIPPNTYLVRRLIVERRIGDRIETQSIGMKRLVFTPVPGKTAYVGSLMVDVSEKGLITFREVREDEKVWSYFPQKYAGSPWASREFIAAGPRPMPTIRVAQEKAPKAIETKPIDRPGFKAEKPEWKIGHEWRYAWQGPMGKGTLTSEIIREEAFEGIPSYVVRTGKNEYYYVKDVLGAIARISGGRLVFKRDAPYQVLSWPLEVGKEWRNSFLQENIQEKSSQTFEYRMVVSGIEEVKVPAGLFEVLKIEVYSVHSGNLLNEYWYSPQVKWFVKTRAYLTAGLRDEALISFKVE